MHVPVFGKGPVTVEHADKVAHFAAYFLLVWLGGRRLSQTARLRLVFMLIVWAVIYALYAGMDEWLQSYVGRTMSLYDWFADLAGIIVATALVAFVRLRAAPTSGSGIPGG
jgi:VanZ family protein